MKKKKTLLLIVAALLLVAVVIGGISAYFTSTPAALTNTFTIGNVQITLTEPAWVAANAQNITPGTEVAKNPTVENTGTNDAYIFVKVEVPYNTTETADVFTLNGITSSWNKIVDSISGSTHTYVYAYAPSDTTNGGNAAVSSMVALSNGETATLFTSATLSTDNDVIGSTTSYDIVVNAYAVQTNVTETTQSALYALFGA